MKHQITISSLAGQYMISDAARTMPIEKKKVNRNQPPGSPEIGMSFH